MSEYPQICQLTEFSPTGGFVAADAIYRLVSVVKVLSIPKVVPCHMCRKRGENQMKKDLKDKGKRERL